MSFHRRSSAKLDDNKLLLLVLKKVPAAIKLDLFVFRIFKYQKCFMIFHNLCSLSKTYVRLGFTVR